MPSAGKENRVVMLGGSAGTTADAQGVNLFTSNDNSTVTPTSGSIADFSDVVMTSAPFTPPALNYGNVFTADLLLGLLTYTGSVTRGFRIALSGVITSTSLSNDDHFRVKLLQGSGVTFLPFTGGNKRYSAGKSTGQVTSEVGFSFEVFGSFEVGTQLKIQISKDFIGDATMKEVICVFSPVTAGIF